MTLPLSHVTTSNMHLVGTSLHRDTGIMSRRLLLAFSSAIALHMSPGLAQTESTRLLEKGESPKVVNVKNGDTHTDQKPGMKEGTWTITTTVASSPSASLQGTKGYGQVVNTTYGKLSFAEIQKHEKKDEILDDIMTPEQQKEYSIWKKGIKEVANQTEKQIDTNIQVANQRIDIKKQIEQVANQTEKQIDTNIQVANQTEKQIDTNIQVANQEGRKLDAELIKKYYAYVANIEAGSSGERAVLHKILEKEFTPPDLRVRIENILNRKDSKFALK